MVGVVFSRDVTFSEGGGPCVTVLVASAVLSALSMFILGTAAKIYNINILKKE